MYKSTSKDFEWKTKSSDLLKHNSTTRNSRQVQFDFYNRLLQVEFIKYLDEKLPRLPINHQPYINSEQQQIKELTPKFSLRELKSEAPAIYC